MQQKKLSKTIFFLDVKGTPTSRTRALEIRLKSLGGKIQDNLTKSVNVVITNQQLLDNSRRLRSATRDSNKSSREEILEKARLWNVQLKHINDVSNWINSLSTSQKSTITYKEPRRTPQPKRRSPTVKKHVLKVEDNSRAYQPNIKNITVWPTIVAETSRRMLTRHGAKEKATVKSTRRNAITEAKRPGYCESCNVRFVNTITHLNSAKHVKFASNQENYKNLDKQLKKGKTVDDFIKEITGEDSKVSSPPTTRLPRQRSAPASVSPKQVRRKSNGLPNRAAETLVLTPVRGIGALQSPPDDVPTPAAGASQSTTDKRYLKPVKRKLFSDDENGDPSTSKKAKQTSTIKNRRYSGVATDLQERTGIHHFPIVTVQKFSPTSHMTLRRSSTTNKNTTSIRNVARSLKRSLKSNSPVLTTMEMRNGKMKICNGL